jgi:hypothetical protein
MKEAIADLAKFVPGTNRLGGRITSLWLKVNHILQHCD